MRLIDADELYYEDVECTDGNIYSVVHAPEIDNADNFDLSEHDKQVRADAIDEFANKLINELHYNVSAKPITINTPYATPIMIDGEIQKVADKLKEQNK